MVIKLTFIVIKTYISNQLQTLITDVLMSKTPVMAILKIKF